MSGFMYKVREFLQNLIPVAIIGALAFGGYTLYKQGTFRHGLKPAMNSIVRKIPYFGTKFGHYTSGSSTSSRSSYVASSSGKRSRVSRRHRAPRKHKMLTKRNHHRKHRRHR